MSPGEGARPKRRTWFMCGATTLGLILSVVAYAASGDSGNATSRPSQNPTPVTVATATFAGGCFWCMEPPFDALDGVVSTTSGYIGGHVRNPTYKQVSAGGTGHAEAVQVIYDPSKVGYPELLEIFWRNIDPVAVDRQFCDHGDQYRSAIFTHNAEQAKLAEASRASLASSGKFAAPIATQVVAASEFWPAEDYHQDYYRRNPVRYKYYRHRCGRDARLEAIWGEAG